VVESGDAQVTLDWNDAALDDGDAYQVYVDDRAVDLSVSGSRFTVTGLQNGTPYRFRISGTPGELRRMDGHRRGYASCRGPRDGCRSRRSRRCRFRRPGSRHDAASSGAGGRPGAARGETPVVPAFRLLATPRLRAFTRDGLRVGVTCAAGCRAVVRVEVSARVARALRTSRTLARSSSRRLRGEAELAVAVRPSGNLSRRLRGHVRLDATIVMETTDASGSSRRVSRRVILRR
jgi:hypothetical protein